MSDDVYAVLQACRVVELSAREVRRINAQGFRSQGALKAARERDSAEQVQAQAHAAEHRDQELHDRLRGVGDREPQPYDLRNDLDRSPELRGIAFAHVSAGRKAGKTAALLDMLGDLNT